MIRALVVLASLLPFGPTATLSQWVPHLGQPPIELIAHAPTVALTFENPKFVGLARYSLTEKKITIDWRHQSSGLHTFQEIPVSYWPTSITKGPNSDQAIAVAGKRRNGNTVIEEVVLVPPLVLPGPPITFTLRPPSSIEAFYDEATQGRDMVVHMVPNKVAGRVIAQFFDSHGVYSIDSSPPSTPPILIAQPSPSPGVLSSAWLNNHFEVLWSGDHVDKGYVYVFRSFKPLVLGDANRDGLVDFIEEIPTTADWISRDYADSAKYH